MRSFASLFLRVTGSVLSGCFILVGAVAAFSSFFFEESRSQMTWAIAGEHLAVFVGAMLALIIGVRLMAWSWK